MRILFLLPDFPYPPSTGGRAKVFNELIFLSKTHQCDVLCFGHPDSSEIIEFSSILPNVHILGIVPERSGLSKLAAMILNVMCLVPPSFAAYRASEFGRLFKHAVATGSYDVVHYDIINMAQYLKNGPSVAAVHSPNDATSLSYFRMAEQVDWSIQKLRLLLSAYLIRKFEKSEFPLFSKVHVVSDVDAQYLKHLNAGMDIETIPITIDGDFLKKTEVVSAPHSRDGRRPTIICTGNLKNPGIAKGIQLFLDQAYPDILDEMPDIRLCVLGPNVSSSLRLELEQRPNVEFYEWVDDYRDFISQADVILAPDLDGTGIKTRVVQAMGLGLPVVGTETAFEGIPFEHGKHGMRYRTMSECTSFVLRLLSDQGLRQAIGDNAHRRAVEKFSLNNVGPKYEKLYQDAVKKFSVSIELKQKKVNT